jgi:opacity protein-like surface antigen
MKTDARTSVALVLLAVATSAGAQNAQPVQPDPQPPAPAAPTPTPPQPTVPAQQPQQNVQPVAPAGPSVPQSPPPARYPPPQQYQYPSQQTSPSVTTRPPPAQWVHSDTAYGDYNGFEYHPFRFQIEGGGTITQRTSENYLKNGWNVGAGLTWYPTSHLPVGVRVSGIYNEFSGRGALLDQATATYGTSVTSATEKIWGGDTDLVIDLPFSHYVHAYLLAGGGWYKEQITYRQTNYSPGFVCSWYGCGPGYFGTTNTVARTNSDWHFARNAGFGLDFAMGPRASFFVEARYMRIDPNNAKSDFLPIQAGFRF